MKKLYTVIMVSLFMMGFGTWAKAQTEDDLVEICGVIAQGATYLRDFKIRLDAGDPPPTQRFSIILKKGIKYRISVCNSKDFEGRVIVELYDNNRLLASTYNVATGQDHPFIDYICSKTGAYHFFFRFRDGKPGLAVGLLSLVETM